MESLPPFLMMALVGVVVVVAIIYSRYLAKKRREEIEAFAARHGYTLYSQQESGCGIVISQPLGTSYIGGSVVASELGAMFSDFQPFGVGHSRTIRNAMTGQLSFGTFYSFDYAYTVGSGKNSHRYTYSIAAFRVPLAFKRLTLRHEGFTDRIAEVFGARDIQFESEEFNRAYNIKCDDEKFAFDIIHPEMMAYLLALPDLNWQLFGPFIVLIKMNNFSIADLEYLPSTVQRFIDLIPEYVRQDIGFRPTWSGVFDH